MTTNSSALEDLIAKLFIARRDVKAYQAGPGPYIGQYFTDIAGDRKAEHPNYRPWDRAAIQAHLSGQATYGHYLLNTDNHAKLFAFDLDIDRQALLPHVPIPDMSVPQDDAAVELWRHSFCFTDGREAWQDRKHPARTYMKFAMRSLATTVQRVIEDELGLPTATAYTGAKGLHVYAFTGLMPAAEIREAAMLVIEALPIKPIRGKMIYQWQAPVDAPTHEHELFTIEVFPKQDEISAEGGFGNLMRLPLGRNQKSNDPTFFVDTQAPLYELRPDNAYSVLNDALARLS